MEVLRPAGASEFLGLALPLLERDEARNQLPLAVAGTAVAHPEAYDEARFWVAIEDGEPVSAALHTMPYGALLADPVSDAGLTAVLAAVAADDPDVPGLVGMAPHIDAAARALAASTGRRAERMLSQGVYALREVRPVPRAPGVSRRAGDGDRELLRRWFTDFATESLPDPGREIDRIDRTLDVRLHSGDAGYWLWEEGGEPVSLSGFGGPTPNGIRIGPVYTPPEHRRRGYATTLVADQSAWLLERGYRFCFLYTDLENPTSNRIYEEIGYERVGDSADYRFVEA
jgi:predicted GNAT family acetyltransferase